MKKILKSKKGIVLLATLVVALGVAAFGAYAYFTASGSGSGTASVGDVANNLYVTGTAGSTLYPGGAAATVTFSAKNFDTSSAQSISSIHLTNVQSCAGAWSAPDLSAYPVPAPSCPDVGYPTAADSACDATGFSNGAVNDLTKSWWMPDTTVDPSSHTDGDIAAGATQSLTSTGTITMNNTTSNQDPCKNKHLLLTFTTS